MSSDVWVCLKWVFQANEPSDARFAGMSPADHAALELALQHATQIRSQVTAVTVGPRLADAVLREAIACGATRAIRVDAPTATTSVDVASAIASVARQAAWVWCGDTRSTMAAAVFPPSSRHRSRQARHSVWSRFRLRKIVSLLPDASTVAVARCSTCTRLL